MFPISRSEKIPRKLSAKKREINSPESRLIACLSRGRLFIFFLNLPPRRRRVRRAPRHVRTHVDIRGASRGYSPLLPCTGERKKKERKLFGERTKEEEGEGGMRAGVGETETGSTKRARERESACRSEALYPSVERDLGAQCYDGHQADRSQPLSASSGPHVVPTVRPTGQPYVSLNRI